jgi:alpha-beta hydrolase superfamily lysophospholipase
MSASEAQRVHHLKLDVSAAVRGAGEHYLAVTAFIPPLETMPKKPIVIFGVPGGGYSRGYFDMRFSGHAGYSEAHFHQANGIIFVSCDHIGVGESSQPDPPSIDFAMLADTYRSTVEEVCRRLGTGTLAEGVPPLPGLTRIGIGQSMGGKVTVLTQGRHAVFDGIAVLGASAIHTQLPQPTEEMREKSKRAHVQVRDTPVDPGSVARSSTSIADFIYPFHWEDEPADIVQADIGAGYPLRRAPVPAFGSATIPPCAVTMMSPGCIATEAAQVSVPVLIGVGERDVCPNPHAEPAAYSRSSDITVYIAPRMAHMHNFASTRVLFWERIERWAQNVAASKGGAHS